MVSRSIPNVSNQRIPNPPANPRRIPQRRRSGKKWAICLPVRARPNGAAACFRRGDRADIGQRVAVCSRCNGIGTTLHRCCISLTSVVHDDIRKADQQQHGSKARQTDHQAVNRLSTQLPRSGSLKMLGLLTRGAGVRLACHYPDSLQFQSAVRNHGNTGKPLDSSHCAL